MMRGLSTPAARARANAVVVQVVVLVLLVVLLVVVSPLTATFTTALRDDPKTDNEKRARLQLQCAVCETVVDEVEERLGRELSSGRTHTVQSRFRIDEKRHIPYSRTEYRLYEIFENELPMSIDNFGITNHTGRIRLWRAPFSSITYKPGDPMPTSPPKMPPPIAEYDPSEFQNTQQSKLLVKDAYHKFMDANLDQAVLMFHREEQDVKTKLCVKKAKVCPKGTTFGPITEPKKLPPREIVPPTPTEEEEEVEHPEIPMKPAAATPAAPATTDAAAPAHDEL